MARQRTILSDSELFNIESCMHAKFHWIQTILNIAVHITISLTIYVSNKIFSSLTEQTNLKTNNYEIEFKRKNKTDEIKSLQFNLF